MKKILSVIFAFFIFLSVMHITIAMHYCQGKISAVKFSVTGEKAFCGMDNDKNDETGFSSNCCSNVVSVYTVDQEYTFTDNQNGQLQKNLLQVVFIPVRFLLHHLPLKNDFYTDVSPPGIFFANVVNLADICILRL